MKKSTKLIIVLMAIFMMLPVLFAQELTPNPETDFDCELSYDGKSAFIKKYIGKSENVVIPAEIEGFPVTYIDDRAFSGSKVRSVVIPEGVTGLGLEIFRDTENLKSVKFPSTLTTYRRDGSYVNNMFRDSNIEEIIIPDSVKEIPRGFFSSARNLKSVTLPQGLTKLPENAFSQCSSLEEITLPPNLKTIGGEAFSWCESLKSITLPDSVEEIDMAAFRHCSSLTSINIPASIKSIDTHNTFDSAPITDVTIPDSIKPNSVEDAYRAFIDCKLPLKVKARLKEISK